MSTELKAFVFFNRMFRDNRGIYYNLEVQLGAGSFGEVYRCRRKDADQLDESVPHKVAVVKVQKTKTAWENEISALITLGVYIHGNRREEDKHNIVNLLGWFHIGNVYGLLMEHMRDGDLYSLQLRQPWQRFPLETVSTVMRHLLKALDWLKEKDIIHTDLKPDNILVDLTANSVRVKLADFGSVISRNDVSKYVGRQIQAAAFRAPEIFLGAPFTEAIDMWSLGILCGMMTFGFGYELFEYYNPLDSLQVWWFVWKGIPSEILDAGKCTGTFFKKTRYGDYTFKSYPTYNRLISIQNSLNDILIPAFGTAFSTFLFGCLDINPEIRLTPKKGLETDFVNMMFR